MGTNINKMKDIIEQLTEWKENINYDIQQSWNDDKIKDSLQLLRIEQAINLLENVGENRNIS